MGSKIEKSATCTPHLDREPGLCVSPPLLGGGLERMAGSFVGHLPRRQSAEFFVNDGEKFGGGFWITLFHPFQNMRGLAQVFRIGK